MTQDEFSCLYEENSFTCIIKKGLAMLDGDRIRIEHIDSDMEVLTIPDELPVTLFDIQGRSYTRILPVSELGKKACYEKKNLKQVRLGKNFRFLDDYAFARCEHLTEVVAEGIDGFADLRLGNGVFDDCGSLEILALDGDREAKIARLLAAVPRFLKAEDLLVYSGFFFYIALFIYICFYFLFVLFIQSSFNRINHNLKSLDSRIFLVV